MFSRLRINSCLPAGTARLQLRPKRELILASEKAEPKIHSQVLLFLVFFLCFFPFGHQVSAETIYLRDLPKGHYAYDAVYDLIKMGVTSGYPDGTFRGNKKLSRYEVATLLVNFSNYFARSRAANEKLVAELRAETNLLAYQQDRAAQETRLSGRLIGRWRYAENAAGRGGMIDYRLQSEFSKEFAEGVDLKIKLDTLDSGWGGTSRNLIRELLVIEGLAESGPLTLRISEGPGSLVHRASGVFASDDGITFDLPRRSFGGELKIGRLAFGGDLTSRSNFADGTIEVLEIRPIARFNFSDLQLVFCPRLFSAGERGRAAWYDLSGELSPGGALKLKALTSWREGAQTHNDFYFRGELAGGDLCSLLYQELGASYRPGLSFGIYDQFGRPLSDGTKSLGWTIKTPAWRGWVASWRGEWREPDNLAVDEFSFGLKLNKKSIFSLFWQRLRQTTESRMVGLKSEWSF